MGSVVRLSTAAHRKVQQRHDRATRAARAALPRLPVEFVPPWKRARLAEKEAEDEALQNLKRTPELAILLALMATMPSRTLNLAVDEAAKIAPDGGPSASAAHTLLKIAAARQVAIETIARMEADHG